MPPVKRDSSSNSKPRRGTFPATAKKESTGGTVKKKGMPVHIRKKLEAEKKIPNHNELKKDKMMKNAFRKRGWNKSNEMIEMVYRNCYLLLQGIAKVMKSELVWENEHKDAFFYSRVNLTTLKIEIKPTVAVSEIDSHMVAAYSYLKFLVGSRGLLPNQSLFIHLLVLSSESELARLAVLLTPLIDSFAKTFGSIIGNRAFSNKCRSSFDEVQAVTMANLKSLLSQYGKRQPEIRNTKDLISSLVEVYCQIENNRKENGNSMNKGTKKVFESSYEEEEISSKVSMCGAIVNGEEEEDEVDVKPAKKLNREIEEEKDEEMIEKKKKKKRKKEENEEENVDDKRNGDDMDREKEGDNEWMLDAFRSNMREVASELWKKNVELFGIRNVPCVNDRSTMARLILLHLNEKYGDEFLEILQYLTIPSFSLQCLKQDDEVIGLVLYLDGRELIGDYFFFLIIAMNDENVIRDYLDRSEICCRAQMEVVRIAMGISIGKPLPLNYEFAKKEACFQRKSMENRVSPSLFRNFFQGLREKMGFTTLREKLMAIQTRKMKTLRKKKFEDEFWLKSLKFVNDESDWNVYDVNESAVKVYNELENAFQGSLFNLIKSMNGWRPIYESTINDPTSGLALASLIQMKDKGFFEDSLLFLLLRFGGLIALRHSADKLSTLCTDFQSIVETGSKSKELKTHDRFQSRQFVEKALRINEECLAFYEEFLNSKGRKRCISTLPTTEDSGENEERDKIESVKRRKKKRKEEFDENEENEDSQSIGMDKRRVKIEDNEEEKKKVKVEVISDEEEKEENEKKSEEGEPYNWDEIDADAPKLTKKHERKIKKMKDTPYVDGNWRKHAQLFNIQSDWSVYEVCSSAIVVIKHLDTIFNGELVKHVERINQEASNFHKDTIFELRTRKALEAQAMINRLKIFPKGFIFLLIRSGDESVIEKASSLIAPVVPQFLRFINDFRDPSSRSKDAAAIQRRVWDLNCNVRCRGSMEYLMQIVLGKKEPFEVTSQSKTGEAAKVNERSFNTVSPLPNESEWKYNSKWKVTTVWSRSEEVKEWEKRNEMEIERLAQRMRHFAASTVTCDKHYQRKLKVFDFVKKCLSEVMERKKTSLHLVGSSGCNLGAYNSNLDLFYETHEVKSIWDESVLTEPLSKEEGITIVKGGKGTIYTTICNELTEGEEMEVTIHFNPASLYMAYVYPRMDYIDERLAPILLTLKAWKVLDPHLSDLRVTSYHMTVFLIHFLQCGVSPPILPSLTLLYPTLDPSLFRGYPMFGDNPVVPRCENTQSVSSLLIGFFLYYSGFEFEKFMISIREGRLIKRDLIEEKSNKTISIELPNTSYLKKKLYVFTDLDCVKVRDSFSKSSSLLTSTFKMPSLPYL